MTKHAKLSASGASRWINCPGSIALEAEVGVDDTCNIYAQEGTLAHEIAELKLSKWAVKGIGPKKFKTKLDKLKANELYQPEMDNYTDNYADYVKEVALSYTSSPYVVLESKVDFSDIVPEGFGTADCILICDKDLHIIDLKYGKGVEVNADNNPQLMLYALGALSAYDFIYDIENIYMHIVQPRLDNYSAKKLSVAELKEFGKKVKPIALDAYNGSEVFNCGDHCKFCRAKQRCRARAVTMFKAVEEIDKIKEKDMKEELTPDEIAYFLKKSEGVAKWISDLEDEALSQLLKGVEIKGYKAVEGRSNREFKNMDNAFNILTQNGVEEALLYERKPLSLSKIEKLIGKSEFNSLLADEINKPPGKPTLAKESDKREALNSASRMFKKVKKREVNKNGSSNNN